MVECSRCHKLEEQAKLLDVILDNEVVKICEECSSSEGVPVIKRPTTSQLKESERPYTVKERLRRMTGLHEEKKKEISKIAKKITDVTLDDLYKRKKEKELEEKFELSKKMNKPLNLIDNFHWHVFMARRKKKLTRKELAELLGESETAIKMIESKELPDESLGLINKLEQFLGIKLKKEEVQEEKEEIEKAVKEGMDRKEIPDKIEIKHELEDDEPLEKVPKDDINAIKKPAMVLKFNEDSVENITISDLQDMKNQKEEKEKLRRQSKMEAGELLGEVEKEKKTEEKEKWEEEAKNQLIGDDIEIE